MGGLKGGLKDALWGSLRGVGGLLKWSFALWFPLNSRTKSLEFSLSLNSRLLALGFSGNQSANGHSRGGAPPRLPLRPPLRPPLGGAPPKMVIRARVSTKF